MAAHTKPVSTVAVRTLVVCLVLAGPTTLAQVSAPQRIISLVPSVTEMLFAIGAGSHVVGIGSFDQLPDPAREPQIARVGGLLDPDMERILSLRPDLVVLYASQTDAREQLERAGVALLPYQHGGGLYGIPHSIRELGTRTGHQAQSEAVAERLETGLAAIRARVAGRPRPRTLLVFGREPLALRNVYASGGVGFLHDMLDVAGGENVFADVESENVAQVSSEALLIAAPDVVVEIRYEGSLPPDTVDAEREVWHQLPAVPAVRNGRIYFLAGNQFVVPGPRVLQATEELARVLHPEAFE